MQEEKPSFNGLKPEDQLEFDFGDMDEHDIKAELEDIAKELATKSDEDLGASGIENLRERTLKLKLHLRIIREKSGRNKKPDKLEKSAEIILEEIERKLEELDQY